LRKHRFADFFTKSTKILRVKKNSDRDKYRISKPPGERACRNWIAGKFGAEGQREGIFTKDAHTELIPGIPAIAFSQLSARLKQEIKRR
jgi:hypothetical protein